MPDQRQAFFDERAAGWEASCYPANVRARLEPLVARLGLSPGVTVLDMGTGPGTLLPYLRRAVGGVGRIAAFDISFAMTREAARKRHDCAAEVVQATAMALPFADACFDAVICFAAFPHFADKGLALREMRRVARPGARLWIAHLLGREQLMAHHGAHDAVKDDCLPDETAMRRLFRQAGFPDPCIEDRPDGYVATAVAPPGEA